MPCSVARRVPGIHSQPPERAVVPPKRGSLSTTSTFSPCDAAVMAVDMPDAPLPTTSTSHSKLVCSICLSCLCLCTT
jgi:hypothetical protein